jgi:hypothetical protein
VQRDGEDEHRAGEDEERFAPVENCEQPGDHRREDDRRQAPAKVRIVIALRRESPCGAPGLAGEGRAEGGRFSLDQGE